MTKIRRPDRSRLAAAVAGVPLIEPLEGRRLLTATLDAASGVLTINGTTGKDIVQFQVSDNAAANGTATTFDVIESTTLAASPAKIPSRAAVGAFIGSGTGETRTTFDVGSVNTVVINSGAGDDLVIVGSKLTVPVLMNGGNGNDSLSGGQNADSISAGSGDDYVYGRGGDDIVSGDLGADEIFGGAGFDTTEYKDRTNTVTVGIGNIADDGEVGEGDNVRNDIEGVVGGSGDDSIGADNSNLDPSLGVLFYGGAGNDLLRGFGGSDTLIGGEGSDTLEGQGGDDFLYAQQGQDDILTGGDGFDVGVVDTGDASSGVEEILKDDVVGDPDVVGTGSATLSNRTLTLNGTSGTDRFTVQPSVDDTAFYVRESRQTGGVLDTFAVTRYSKADVDGIVLDGNAGDDLLAVLSNLGSDIAVSLNGGTGDDTIVGGLGDDSISDGEGDDFVFGRAGDDTIVSNGGKDFLSGGDQSDTVDYSGRSGDLLIGLGLLPDDGERGESDNILDDVETVVGGSGNDNISTTTNTAVRFVGNAGRDTLTGAGGGDFFAARDGERDVIRGNGGNDDGDFDDQDDVDLGDGQ